MTRTRDLSNLLSQNFIQPNISPGRCRVNYWTTTAVEVWVPDSILMSGFRANNQYKRPFGKSFPSPSNDGRVTVSFGSQLGAEISAQSNSWYAVFAVANDGDASASFRLMPFVRVGGRTGDTVTFTYGGEGANAFSVNPITFSWPTDSLNGADCLVINEGSGNRFSGRVTTINDSAAASLTLGNVSGTPGFSIGAFDFLLPAPPGWDHYCYLGSVYYESPGSIRNIADSGSIVKARMINLLDPNFPTGGAIASPGVQLRFGGHISPLATGVIVKESASFSTSATGDYAGQFAHDGSFHDVDSSPYFKASSTTQTAITDNIIVPFSIGQFCYFWTAGSLISLRSLGKVEIRGWIEN